MMTLRLYLVASEPSADAIAARLLHALRAQLAARNPPVALAARGVGGPRARAAGLHATPAIPASDLAVMGVGPALVRALPRIAYRAAQVVRDAATHAATPTKDTSTGTKEQDVVTQPTPHVAVFVDGKGFARRVAPWMPANTHKVQYVGPSVWAWKGGLADARRFARIFDRVLLLFPFEHPAWERAGVGHVAHVVGSPAVEEHLLLDSPCQTHHTSIWTNHNIPTPPRAPVNAPSRLCVMLGSRRSEIRRHGPVVGDALDQLAGALHVVVPVATSDLHADVQAQVEGWARYRAGQVQLVSTRAETHAALAQSDVGIVASGTATLEAALAGLPCVVIYKTGWFTELVARARAVVRFVSIPNIVMDHAIMPEILFTACTPSAIAVAVTPLLQEEDLRNRQRKLLHEARRILLVHGLCDDQVLPSARAAQCIIDLVASGPHARVLGAMENAT